MTALVPTPRRSPAGRLVPSGRRRLSGRVAAGVAAVLLAAVGCKNREGGLTGGAPPRDKDVLIVGPGRIPKQNIPIPDRGTGTAGGVKGRGDPLLGSPAARPSGSGYTDDPERWKGGPYVNGPGGTPAALAGRTRDDGDGLKIESPGAVTPTGGSSTHPTTDGGPAPEALYAELGQYGVKRGDYTAGRENGKVVFRVKVPISGREGVRGYVGVGATETEAVRHALRQVKDDRGK